MLQQVLICNDSYLLQCSHDHTPLHDLVTDHQPVVDVGILLHEALSNLPAPEHYPDPGHVCQGSPHHQPPLPLVSPSQGDQGLSVSKPLGAEILHHVIFENEVGVDTGFALRHFKSNLLLACCYPM